jgi:DNA-binding transcriptional MerR regulator
MLRIGDFSQLGQVSVPTLRHYDELGLLKPAHVDKFTEYRYYTLEQLPRLNRILALKDLGLALDQIKLLIERDLPVDQLRGMLLMKRADIERSLVDEQARLARVEARLQAIERENELVPIDVVLRHQPAQSMLVTRQFVPHVLEMGPHRYQALTRLYEQVRVHKLNPLGQEYSLYFHTEYSDVNIEMAMGLVVSAKQAKTLAGVISAPFELITLPDGELACSTHNGSALEIPVTIINIMRWVAANGYHLNGGMRECHLSLRELETYQATGAGEVIYELQMPVARS